MNANETRHSTAEAPVVSQSLNGEHRPPAISPPGNLSYSRAFASIGGWLVHGYSSGIPTFYYFLGMARPGERWNILARYIMINAAAAAKPVAAPCIRVALVEDDRQVREGLAVLIGNSPGLACVAACVSAEIALQRLPALDPDVVLMDIQLPGISGIECILRLKHLCPGAQIMMLTVFEDHDRIYQSLKAGASGYLLKQTPPAELLAAITELHRGGAPMSSQIARRVVEAFQRPVPTDAGDHQLSPREQEIVSLLAQGHLYKEIADQLGRSVETVRTHIRNIYDKLHVRTRTEAVNKIYGAGARPVA